MRQPLEAIYGVEGTARLWSDFVDGMAAIVRQKDGNIGQEMLPKIRCATLIARGGLDAMVSPAESADLGKSISGAEYFEIAKGRHNFHLRFADEYNRVVCEFLTRTN